ncbi:phage Gp37/Gp68 family protein [Paraburkholderia hospita]|uniref:DUF5131 family protein n=1 Tax=Paraburkholderia hospita TaxID=169430 RepID=UPI003ECC9448
MSENSKTEWTDHTFNSWEGCQKVGPGCDRWYAETRNARFAGGNAINWGLAQAAPMGRVSRNVLAASGRRQRVLFASLADVFDNAVDPAWRTDVFDLIEKTLNLDWLLLMKRIRMRAIAELKLLAHPAARLEQTADDFARP